MSVDNDVALIGSGNMDKRSFDLNFEISMLFYDKQVTQALRGKEAKYLEHAEELNFAAWLERSNKERFLQDISKLVSPLL
jgi:cardiolipin synthase